MRKASILAAALILAACSRNPEPDVEATGAADTTMSDTTMMAGDSTQMSETGTEGDTAQAAGDSARVNQEGAVQPGQDTMQSDTVMGDSTRTGPAEDTRTPGDTTMMHGDSTMAGPETSVDDAAPMDSTHGQRP